MRSEKSRVAWTRELIPAAGLALAAGAGYFASLAPTVLDGDAALFQYVPAVLGVPYPTGYPTYVWLGHVWQLLLPVASAAWRMNALSAVCAALSIGLLYLALKHWLNSRVGALAASLAFATLPTFWRWSTEAKSYTLHILFLAVMLYLVARAERASSRSRSEGLLVWLAVVFGLALGNHNTTLLLAPGIFLLYWLNGTEGKWSSLRAMALRVLPAVAIAIALYAFIPLRANHLLADYGQVSGLTIPVAVSHGLVSDFYHPGLAGLVRYFTASDFTGGVVSNWGDIPAQLVSVYWPLLRDDFPLWIIGLAVVGAAYLAIRRPKRFWPLFLIYVVLIPFVLTYGRGEQSAFLLPSSLMVATFAGAAVGVIWSGGRHLIAGHIVVRSASLAKALYALLAMVLTFGLGWPLAQRVVDNIDWLQRKWDDSHEVYWRSILTHPIEPDSGLLAQWGDLTTFWYLQQMDGLRPDLYGLYPPSAGMVRDWVAAGHSLYVAGPVQDWGAALPKDYRIVPWGQLLRVVPGQADVQALLPPLVPATADSVFGGEVTMLGSTFGPAARPATWFPVTIAWRTGRTVPADARISLRLTNDQGDTVVQGDERLFSGWLPYSEVAQDTVFLSFHLVEIPAGAWPGTYQLQVALSDPENGAWRLADGEATLDLGSVEVLPDLGAGQTDPWHEYKPKAGVNFGDEIRLVGYDYSVTRAGQGKGFAAEFLWQALRRPAGNYTLLVQVVNGSGQVMRQWHHVPTDGNLPTSSWVAGQYVRDRVDLVLPADTPPGDNTIHVRLSWLREDGSRLPRYRFGLFPAGSAVMLPGVRVVEKEDRVFTLPEIDQAINVNFDNKITLAGYNLKNPSLPAGETLSFDLVWQSQTSDMQESYVVFVHLVGPDGLVYAQGDKAPGYRSKQPTTAWVKGEVIVDPISIQLPEDLTPGNYTLRVGLYQAPDGPRLPTIDGEGMITGDSVAVTEVSVLAR